MNGAQRSKGQMVKWSNEQTSANRASEKIIQMNLKNCDHDSFFE